MSSYSLSAIGLFLVITGGVACSGGGDSAPASPETPQTTEAPVTTAAQTTVAPTTTAVPTTIAAPSTTAVAPTTTTTTTVWTPLLITSGHRVSCEIRWWVYVFSFRPDLFVEPISLDLWIDEVAVDHSAQFIEDPTFGGMYFDHYEDRGYEGMGYFELLNGKNVDIDLDAGSYWVSYRFTSGRHEADFGDWKEIEDCGS